MYTTQEAKSTTAMKNVFNFLEIGNYKKKISGYEFFGLQRQDVIKQLQAKVSRKRKSDGDIQESNPIYDTKKKNRPANLSHKRIWRSVGKFVEIAPRILEIMDVLTKINGLTVDNRIYNSLKKLNKHEIFLKLTEGYQLLLWFTYDLIQAIFT